jgi:hypothetical protein
MLLQGGVLNIKDMLQGDGDDLNTRTRQRNAISHDLRPRSTFVSQSGATRSLSHAKGTRSTSDSSCGILFVVRALHRLSGFAPASESGHDLGRVPCGKL